MTQSKQDAGTEPRGRLSSGAQVTLSAGLAFGACGHFIGTFAGYPAGTELFIWSLAGVLACAMLSALNFIRLHRHYDMALTWLCIGGCAAWAVLSINFNLAIHNLLDVRGLIHFVASAGLAGFCAIEVISTRRTKPRPGAGIFQ